jgi:putative flippase GtrA
MRARALRYLAVGATCALLYNVLMISLVSLGVGVLWATVIVVPPLLLTGYVLHAVVTFETRFSRVDFLRYSLTILAAWPASAAIVYGLADLAGLPIVLAAPLTTAIMLVLNWITAHWAIAHSLRAAFACLPLGRPERP